MVQANKSHPRDKPTAQGHDSVQRVQKGWRRGGIWVCQAVWFGGWFPGGRNQIATVVLFKESNKLVSVGRLLKFVGASRQGEGVRV